MENCAFCHYVFALAERRVRYGKKLFHDPRDKSCLLLWKTQQRRKENGKTKMRVVSSDDNDRYSD